MKRTKKLLAETLFIVGCFQLFVIVLTFFILGVALGLESWAVPVIVGCGVGAGLGLGRLAKEFSAGEW